jgi:hypothetical protein
LVLCRKSDILIAVKNGADLLHNRCFPALVKKERNEADRDFEHPNGTLVMQH